ncbi:hypothetical protein KBZ15_06010 [Cyanobium sp. BA20m-p-22]|uniref:hypothetical protein n=1 Tax=Cyanobium sp. BA20m-p-22 TaxID=2823704 RepID=UPI0020CC002B|nr:hypothetical protein [Cyanobium sp. BA20m-p-22]MCP9909467.1 hypothetical protein [Cyanobium sp. BA20m-p-22]
MAALAIGCPKKGCDAFPETGCGSGDATSSCCFYREQEIGSLLLEVLKTVAGGVAGLGYPQAWSSGVERHLANVDIFGGKPYSDSTQALGTIERRKVLSSHTS